MRLTSKFFSNENSPILDFIILVSNFLVNNQVINLTFSDPKFAEVKNKTYQSLKNHIKARLFLSLPVYDLFMNMEKEIDKVVAKVMKEI